jgi:hypothetical protein
MRLWHIVFVSLLPGGYLCPALVDGRSAGWEVSCKLSAVVHEVVRRGALACAVPTTGWCCWHAAHVKEVVVAARLTAAYTSGF